MKPIEVKIFLLRKGLTLAEIARRVARDGQDPAQLRVMLSHMVHGHRFYPSLAKRVRRYGLNFQPPPALPKRKAA